MRTRSRRANQAASTQKENVLDHSQKNSALDWEEIDAFIQELDNSLQERCDLLWSGALRRSDQIRNAYFHQSMKLPKSIRNMQVREFCGKYGGNPDLVLESARQQVLQTTGLVSVDSPGQPRNSVVLQSKRAISKTMAMRAISKPDGQNADGVVSGTLNVPMTPARNAQGGNLDYSRETPVNTSLNQSVPFTPVSFSTAKTARRVRRGESIMSVNGSPLVVEPFSSSIAIALDHDPSKPNMKNLTEAERIEAHKKLAELNQQIASLMEEYKPLAAKSN